MVLWGPPGTGKTTLAHIIAQSANAHFERVSAVTSGVADLRRVVSEARDRLGMNGEQTILFVDEIHRFNKAQQDVILPHVERGTVILIGATTENPSFEVISPLLSRARVYTLNQLSPEQISAILDSAMSDSKRGIAGLKPALEDDAREALVALSNGDARSALNTLELAVNGTPPDDSGTRLVSLETVEDAIQRRATLYDKAGDQHYDTISAFIKSVRASDPDAAVYWLARMIHSGEDPMFIARRLVILAAEDVGLADPNALTVAVSAQQAVHLVGMPEGRIPLSEATVYLATAPKSNRAYAAINVAMKDAERGTERTRPPAPEKRCDRPDEEQRLRQGLQVLPRLRRCLHSYAEPPGQPEWQAATTGRLIAATKPRCRSACRAGGATARADCHSAALLVAQSMWI